MLTTKQFFTEFFALLLVMVVGVLLLGLASGAIGAGPTIADVKLAAPAQQTLWAFLIQMPGTLEAQIFYALELFGLMGMMDHYLRLYLSDQINGNLWCYLIHQYPKRTILSVGSYTAWAIGLLSTSTFVSDGGAFVGWMNVIIFALTNGYAADSMANKGTAPAREAWTPEQRTAAAALKTQP